MAYVPRLLTMDVVHSIVDAVLEQVTVAEKQWRSPFANHTNIYKTDDGRPICYCCLRVGHVAKYYWDRGFLCHHVFFVDLPPQETVVLVVAADVQSLGKDLDSLLKGMGWQKKVNKEPLFNGNDRGISKVLANKELGRVIDVRAESQESLSKIMWQGAHCNIFDVRPCFHINRDKKVGSRTSDITDIT